jgi:hypothetical protein
MEEPPVPSTPATRRQRRFSRPLLTALALALSLTAALALQVAVAAASTGLTPGDVVVYRVGTGAAALSSSGTQVFLDEYEPSGKFVETLSLPTVANGSNKPLVASGSATSEGLLTLSGDDNWLMATGYDASLGTAKVGETKATSTPRTVARISAGGEINTTTALTDAANENNIRSAVTSNGTNIWVGGAAGGVRFTTLGSSTSTSLNETDKNVREVSIVDGQLYTSADPTKAGALTIATVGSGLPSTATQTLANLPFATAPKEPYAYSLLTLGLGTTPDTLYLADNEAGAVVKYGLVEGKWVKQGSVTLTGVTGLTANDAGGIVSIFATSSGSAGTGPGVLSEITDSSGIGGTLSGTATTIATTPANEAFRGVAFAPGTTIGTGSAPPPPTPTITPAEESLAAAQEDPTNPTLGLKVADTAVEAGELTVTASSSDKAVAPTVEVTGSGAERTLLVTPGAVGYSTITLKVEAPGGASSTTTVTYGVSAYQGNPSDRYYAGAGNASSAIDVGDGYMVVGDDESNVLRLYHERFSGEPVKTFDFTKVLPVGTSEIDIESSARSGNTLYWMGSLSNKKSGKPDPERDIVFAATITGSGANTELTYLGSYTHLRDDLIAWDEANGNPLGLAASGESGVPSNETRGLNDEGLEFAAGSTSTAYLAFRAPLEPASERQDALMVPVTDFSSLVTDGNPGTTKATFGTPLEWNLGGRGIREIRKNADDEYLVIAGTSDDSNSSFGLYTWNGNPSDPPLLTGTSLSAVNEGAWEDIVSVPQPLTNGASVELLEDNGDSTWYSDSLTSKTGLPSGLQKDLGRVFTLELPVPSKPGAPQLSSGVTPNGSGLFSLAWEASQAGGAVTYTLQHQNAEGGWSDVASGLTATEYSFTAGAPESEGTWEYRVIASDESGESAPSASSSAIVVDKSAPAAPSATPDRAPDYASGGGWYRDSVTVSFSANGDPALADSSPGSGVDAATLSAPETFTTDGSHLASGTVADNVGNLSAPGTLAVQVDASAPSLEVECPANALLGSKGVHATVVAADGQSGLASDPSGTVAIDTSSPGAKTVSRVAVDNVGHATEASCTTEVEAGQTITGTVKGTLTIKAGQDVELTSTARVTGSVKVKAGGSLDIEGATLSGPLSATGATLLRLCGGHFSGAVKVSGSSGPVTIGDGTSECAPNAFYGNVTVKGNTDGVTIEGEPMLDENVFHGSLKVTGNTGGTTVLGNEIASSLTVKANGDPVIDKPNVVEGKSKVQ